MYKKLVTTKSSKGVEDLVELFGDAMKYVIIEDGLLESLRIKWQDAKMSKLVYYIANIPRQYKEKVPKCGHRIPLPS